MQRESIQRYRNPNLRDTSIASWKVCLSFSTRISLRNSSTLFEVNVRNSLVPHLWLNAMYGIFPPFWSSSRERISFVCEELIEPTSISRVGNQPELMSSLQFWCCLMHLSRQALIRSQVWSMDALYNAPLNDCLLNSSKGDDGACYNQL